MSRPIRKHDVPVAAVAVTQHTACAVLGFKNPRAFLDWVIANNVPHARRGMDVHVRVDVATAQLHLDDEREEAAVKAGEPIDEADRVLAAIGRRRLP